MSDSRHIPSHRPSSSSAEPSMQSKPLSAGAPLSADQPLSVGEPLRTGEPLRAGEPWQGGERPDWLRSPLVYDLLFAVLGSWGALTLFQLGSVILLLLSLVLLYLIFRTRAVALLLLQWIVWMGYAAVELDYLRTPAWFPWESYFWLPYFCLAQLIVGLRCCTFAPTGATLPTLIAELFRGKTWTLSANPPSRTAAARADVPAKETAQRGAVAVGPKRRSGASRLVNNRLTRRLGRLVRRPRKELTYRAPESFAPPELWGILVTVLASSLATFVVLRLLPLSQLWIDRYGMRAQEIHLWAFIVCSSILFFAVATWLNYQSLSRYPRILAAVTARREYFRGMARQLRLLARWNSRRRRSLKK